MSVKTFTSLCLVVSLAATIVTGFLLVSRPGPGTPRPVLRLHAQRLVGAVGVGVVSLVGAGVGSILLLRAAREEYRVASRRNLEGLVSGLGDGKKGSDVSTEAPPDRDAR